MKATGIVRRIDDLGRVVIPKEIRRTLRIREGDPLEIFTDREGEVVLKKYSPIGELGEFAVEYAEALYQSTGFPAIITDRDIVVASSGITKKNLDGARISTQLDKVIDERNLVISKTESKFVPITNDGGEKVFPLQMVQPILSNGDPIGSVIICSSNTSKEFTEVESKLLQTASNFLGKQMEQ
jgi:AbrB family transcriptional regulator (stage V sporulation protein T)